jgi:hypothetical protein
MFLSFLVVVCVIAESLQEVIDTSATRGKAPDLIASIQFAALDFEGRRRRDVMLARTRKHPRFAGINPAGSTPKRCGQSTQGIKITRPSSIDVKVNVSIAKAFQDLAEATQTNLALPTNLLQVNLDRDDLLQPGRFVKGGA